MSCEPPSGSQQPRAGRPADRSAVRKRRSVEGKPAAASEPTLPDVALQPRFRIADVADAYGVTPRTVRSWIEKGLLEREKVGNSVFIRVDQIETMLNRSKEKEKS